MSFLTSATLIFGFVATDIGLFTAIIVALTALISLVGAIVWMVLRTATGIVNLYGSIRKLNKK